MYERDYILRLIASVGQMLSAMMHALIERRPDDALEVSREAITALTDAEPSLIDTMTAEGLVTFLSAGGRIDVTRARMLAEVFLVRADAHEDLGDDVQAAEDRKRAQTLLDTAAIDAEGDEAERIADLRTGLAEVPDEG